jgi:hypothetical protein
MHNTNTTIWIVIIIVILIVIFFCYNKTENFATSTEAVNNISSMYNSSDLTATNINATNSMSSPGLYAASITGKNVNIQGDITGQNINATASMSSPNFYGTAITGKDVNIQGSINGDGNISGGGLISRGDAEIASTLTVNGIIKGKTNAIRIGDMPDTDVAAYIKNNKLFKKTDEPGTILYFLTDGRRFIGAIKWGWESFSIFGINTNNLTTII